MKTSGKRFNLISMLVCGLSVSFSANIMAASENNSQNSELESEQAKKEKTNIIKITGSRITRTDTETASPITVITAEDIEQQGHANVFEALRTITANTGGVLDEQETNSFTAAAQTVNLRGFGPGRTLVLLNGNRLPTNPKPYGGEDNFVNLALIPTTAVERIEYLSSGGSAIYGSDAIAGVINIILKKDYEGLKVKARYSDTHDGAGETYRFGLMGGNVGERWSINYGIEFDKRAALFGRDRDWLDSYSDSPREGNTPNDRDILIAYPFGRNGLPNWTYQDPGQAACDANPNFEHSLREGRGYYCGHDGAGDRALRAPRERINAFANFNYQINDTTNFFANVLGWDSDSDAELWNAGWWQQVSVVTDLNNPGGSWQYDIYYQRLFAPNEVPNEQHFDESVAMINFGFEGVIGEQTDYKLSFAWSDYDYKESIAKFTRDSAAQAFIGLGAERYYAPWGVYLMLASDLQANGYTPANAPIDIYQHLNNGEVNGINGFSTADGNSYARSVSFELSGDLFELDNSSVKYAAVFEWNSQGYSLEIDDITDSGGFIGWSGVSGRGDRDHFSVGTEFLIPVTSTIEASVAGRYDYYDDESDVGGAPTYQLGLTWRPADSLLFRAQYGTTFRAPDLHRLFADPSQGFRQVTDYYACLIDNNATIDTAAQVYNFCDEEADAPSVRNNSVGDVNLREETGYGANLGMVWNVTDNLDFSVDVYRIQLRDTVTTLTPSRYSELEAGCRVGFDREGNAIDSNSSSCQELYSRIVRQAGPGGGAVDPISEVFVSSINLGLQEQTGADVKVNYGFDTDAWGRFDFSVSYTNIYQVKFQELQSDPIEDDIRDTSYFSHPMRHRASANARWAYNDFSANIFVNRLGGTRNWDGDSRTGPYVRTNLTTSYNFSDKLRAIFAVNNIFNKRPPESARWEAWPYYNANAYGNGAIGREYYLTVEYEF